MSNKPECNELRHALACDCDHCKHRCDCRLSKSAPESRRVTESIEKCEHVGPDEVVECNTAQEKITDETTVACIDSASIWQSSTYLPDKYKGRTFEDQFEHKSIISVYQLSEPYRTRLLTSQAKDERIAELEEDIKFRDIDCGCNARIVERDAKIKELEEKLKNWTARAEYEDGRANKLEKKLKVVEEALIALKRADDETHTIEDYVEFQNRRMCAFEVCDIALKKLKAE